MLHTFLGGRKRGWVMPVKFQVGQPPLVRDVVDNHILGKSTWSGERNQEPNGNNATEPNIKCTFTQTLGNR